MESRYLTYSDIDLFPLSLLHDPYLSISYQDRCIWLRSQIDVGLFGWFFRIFASHPDVSLPPAPRDIFLSI